MKVLLIEDNQDHVDFIRTLLARSGGARLSLETADTLTTGLEYLAAEDFDIVLLDLSLPDSHGLDTFTRLHDYALALPVVVLTGTEDEELAIQAVRGGAQDYLIKGQMTGSLLTPALRYAIERQQLLVELEEKNRQLQASETRLRTVIAHNADGIVVVDNEGLVRFVNPVAKALFGRNTDGLVGQAFGYPVAEGESTELGIERKDGTRTIAEMRVVRIEWEGQPAYLASLRDITERKRMEVEREKLIEELDAFSHTVAHDLKNPLGSIVGFSEVLERDADTTPADQMRALLHRIAQAGRKMNDIIDSLLLMANVRSGEVRIEPLDMRGIVEEAQRGLSYWLEEHRPEIVLPESWPEALGYGPWVEVVWANYLSNALKYGGSPLRVELGAARQEDGMVRFWVRDNGAGVEPEAQARLFTPFTRLRQGGVGGHGLGLSIVRRIVEKLGGQVGVESAAGQGSTFTFTLPGV